jgi:hypothetical protein
MTFSNKNPQSPLSQPHEPSFNPVGLLRRSARPPPPLLLHAAATPPLTSSAAKARPHHHPFLPPLSWWAREDDPLRPRFLRGQQWRFREERNRSKLRRCAPWRWRLQCRPLLPARIWSCACFFAYFTPDVVCHFSGLGESKRKRKRREEGEPELLCDLLCVWGLAGPTHVWC